MKTAKRGQMKIIKTWLQAKGLDICEKCRGRGAYQVSDQVNVDRSKTCEKCSGTGITDWISKMRQGF